jgi:thiol-disulfide isomerase/thioredoxin
MHKITLLLLLLLTGITAWAEKVDLKTYTETAKNAKVVVVHAGATWCAPCMKMLPEWHAFEGSYKGKVTLVHINADQHDTPEYKKYGPMIEKEEGIPVTFWLDSDGKVLGKVLGTLDQKALASKTDDALSKAR